MTNSNQTNNLLTDINKSLNSGSESVFSLRDAPSDEAVGAGIVELKGKSGVIPVSSVCPSNMFGFTLPLPSSMGGAYYLSDQGVFCDLMTDYQELIRILSIACGFISATFIVLRA